MEVRPASSQELSAIMTVLDAGLLETAVADVRSAIEAGDVFVAAEEGRVLGALVVDPDGATLGARIEAIAVRRGRRGQGIGRSLVRAVAGRHRRLVAEFDGRVRPFWTSLDFVVEPATGADRYIGTFRRDA